MKDTHPSYSHTILPIIRRVREMLLPHYGKIEFRDKQSDKRFELFTRLDGDVEQFLKNEFAKTYPDISFVGEESGGARNENRFWLVDPIDGTTPFVRGLPFCTTMVALVEKGEVVFGAIYNFVEDIIYHAEKGHGTFANGEPIHVSTHPLKGACLTWQTHLDQKENLRWFLRLREKSLLWHFGPSGFEFSLIASGKLDGLVCVSPHGKDYDFAPGSLLVQEAGGVVANIGSRDYDYRNGNFIAANPLVFKELTEDPDAIFPIQS